MNSINAGKTLLSACDAVMWYPFCIASIGGDITTFVLIGLSNVKYQLVTGIEAQK